ncbi:MAG: AraC family transcriptional regulator [Pseudomonadota bacterium]
MADTVFDMPLTGEGVPRFPDIEREISGRGLRFILLPPGKISMFLKAEVSFIDVNLNPIEHLFSFNSDELQTVQVPADSFSFVPFGGEFRISARNVLPGLVVEIDPSYWSESMREEFDISPDKVGFLTYEHDPVAAELGRAGIRLLIEDQRGGETADALALEGIALGLIGRVAARLEDDRSIRSGRPTSTALARSRLRIVTEYIEANLGGRILVSDLAAISGMSVSNFARAFKLSIGVGPARYVTIRRVARAKLLLATGELSVAEIAFVSGFSGQSHLTRNFRELTGFTPAAFRREAAY